MNDALTNPTACRFSCCVASASEALFARPPVPAWRCEPLPPPSASGCRRGDDDADHRQHRALENELGSRVEHQRDHQVENAQADAYEKPAHQFTAQETDHV